MRCREGGPRAGPLPRSRRGPGRMGEGRAGDSRPAAGDSAPAAANTPRSSSPPGLPTRPSTACWNQASSSAAAASAAAAGAAASSGACSQGTCAMPSSCAADQRCTARECFSPTATATTRFRPSTLRGGARTAQGRLIGGSPWPRWRHRWRQAGRKASPSASCIALRECPATNPAVDPRKPHLSGWMRSKVSPARLGLLPLPPVPAPSTSTRPALPPAP